MKGKKNEAYTLSRGEPCVQETDAFDPATATLLAQKNAELAMARDRHDTLIRELFHMEYFQNLIYYDPREAKKDNSAVFNNYKQHYLNRMELVTQGAGPSTRTRRSHLDLDTSAAFASGRRSPATSLSTRAKGKRRVVEPPDTPASITARLIQTRPFQRDTSSSFLGYVHAELEQGGTAKPSSAKGKQRAMDIMEPVDAVGSNSSHTLVRPRSSRHEVTTDSLGLQSNRKNSSHLNGTHNLNDNRSCHSPPCSSHLVNGGIIRLPPSVNAPPSPVRLHSANAGTLTAGSSPSKRPRKRRRTEMDNLALTDGYLFPALLQDSASRATRQGNLLGESPSGGDLPSVASSPKTPLSKFSNIKRIKLVVREPPPNYTNPAQRPSPPQFRTWNAPRRDRESALAALMMSYRDIEPDDESIRKEAKLRDSYAKLLADGRVFLSADDIPEVRDEQSDMQPTDVWGAIVQAVVERKQLADVVESRTRAIAGVENVLKSPVQRNLLGSHHVPNVVAGKVAAYFVARENADLRDKAQIRAHKQMLRELVSFWKKAVRYIREYERQLAEAEEIREGRKHLDAILNQSGALLQTQRADLQRSRSMTASVVQSGMIESLLGSARSQTGSAAVSNFGDEDDEGEAEEEEDVDVEEQGGTGEFELDDGIGNLFSDSDVSASPVSSIKAPDQQKTILESSDRHSVPPSGAQCDEPTVNALHDSSSHQSSSIEPATPLSPGFSFSTSNIKTFEDDRGSTPTPLIFEDTSKDTPSNLLPQVMSPSRVSGVSNTPPIPPPSDQPNLSLSNDLIIPEYLKPYAVAPVRWHPDDRITPPLLLRGTLRPYQQSGLEWLASLHARNLNGILADEMGLGKTIETIALLAHLACDRGIWGPHLIVVPTSVLLNWEMEFKKFLPGFKVLAYHGNVTRRKELRRGWNDKFAFNVCVTSYALASRDAGILKRRAWYYMVLDEAHMIKNFKSQRWNTLLMIRSFRRLLLTGTPLQNNLTELWALLQFIKSGTDFASLKEFGDWFSHPLEKAIEAGAVEGGDVHDEETRRRILKLHTVLRPHLLRRLKRDVEKELPSKIEHLVLCPLSKRQRFLYDEFMARAQTQEALRSGVYQKIANILMQLRKVCNHPDLFEVRPIRTSFMMERSAVADFEIKELLLRRRLLSAEDSIDLDLMGLRFVSRTNDTLLVAKETRRLDATALLPHNGIVLRDAPPKDLRTIAGFRRYREFQQCVADVAHGFHVGYINHLRCTSTPVFGEDTLRLARSASSPLQPFSTLDLHRNFLDTPTIASSCVKSYVQREASVSDIVDRFAFVTPAVVARDIPRIVLGERGIEAASRQPLDFTACLHRASVKLQIAFPDPFLLQFDCGKLQRLAELLRERKDGGHRILIFTQMTRILDILEIFLNFHGYLYLRLDGATKIEDRQYITERFNVDERVFCFIASSRSGGVGINLTGADSVIFYDSDFNPQMDRQCEDRAHRIGQIRDVHIYRFVSQYTVEEAMLRKANQKRSLDDIVIQKGQFDWRRLFGDDDGAKENAALTQALGAFDDTEDALAAAEAAKEDRYLARADEKDFEDVQEAHNGVADGPADVADVEAEDAQEGGTIEDYMILYVQHDSDFFRDWKT